MIVLVLSILFALSINLLLHYCASRQDWRWAIIITLWIGVVVIGFVYLFVWEASISNYGYIASLEQRTQEHDEAIEQQKNAVINSIGWSGLVNWKHSSRIAEAIRVRNEWRVYTIIKKAKYKERHRHWLCRQFMAKPPEGLLD